MVLALIYAGYLFLHDIMEGIIFVAVVVIVVVCIVSTIWKLISNIRQSESAFIIILELILSIAGTALFLYVTQLFASDLLSYGDGLWDMILFAVGLLICGAPWAFALYGWAYTMLSKDPGVCLVGVVFEGVGFGILYALIQWAAS